MPRRHRVTVFITDHARRRWEERGGRGKLTAARVRRRLLGVLLSGAEVYGTAIEVPLGGGLAAVCVPELGGY